MSDWILGLKKAASTWMPGIGDKAIRHVEEQVGQPLPEELRALYRKLDGGTFSTGLELFPLQKRARARSLGVQERWEKRIAGLPARSAWHFGTAGAGKHLFAARKGAVAKVARESPDWFSPLSQEAWVFALKGKGAGNLTLFRSLEALVRELVPPAETEEFGENTFLHALDVVGSALAALEAPAPRRQAPRKRKPSRRR